jgi:hypothetical protein
MIDNMSDAVSENAHHRDYHKITDSKNHLDDIVQGIDASVDTP